MRTLAGVGVAALLFACGSGEGVDPEYSLIIEPATASLSIINGTAESQEFQVYRVEGDTQVDVTADVSFTIEGGGGQFASGTFTPSLATAGVVTIEASDGEAVAVASVTVSSQTTRVDPSLPSNIGDMFSQASADSNLAVSVEYPAVDTMLPPNIGDFEAHWNDAHTFDAYELAVSGDYVTVTSYVPRGAAGTWEALEPSEWLPIQNSQSGGELTIRVRGIDTTAPQSYGEATRIVSLAEKTVDGGIYYWSTDDKSIYRHDMANPGEEAERFFPLAGDTTCVGCHTLSRDGSKMAFRYEGGVMNNGNSLTVSSTELLYQPSTTQWSYASFHPDNKHLVVSTNVGLDIVDTETGTKTNLATGSYAMPDVSPDGNTVVFVEYGAGNPINATNASLVTASLDVSTLTLGTPTTLVAATDATNYYPAYSPDGNWILFNRVSGAAANSNNNPNASLYVVKADGTGTPVHLSQADGATTNFYNSWPKWAPFQQLEGGESIMWLTFSSQRPFGVRAINGNPQVWMASFFPGRVETDPGSASTPAFRLPFQRIDTGNHTAQWTEKVVAVE